jgi:hypothetical protein
MHKTKEDLQITEVVELRNSTIEVREDFDNKWMFVWILE